MSRYRPPSPLAVAAQQGRRVAEAMGWPTLSGGRPLLAIAEARRNEYVGKCSDYATEHRKRMETCLEFERPFHLAVIKWMSAEAECRVLLLRTAESWMDSSYKSPWVELTYQVSRKFPDLTFPLGVIAITSQEST